MATSDQGICIRVSDYSETSQVVTLLTRANGVVRLLAKGTKRARSKSGGAIDLLSQGQCVFAGAGREALATLMEFVETASHSNLRGDLRRLNASLYLLELCGAVLAEGDPHAQVFDLLHSALARLGEKDSSPPVVAAYFQWRLLRHVGLLGEMTACVSCGGRCGPKGVYFSSSRGGLLCRTCETPAVEKRLVSPHALAGVAALSAAAAGRRVHLTDTQAEAAIDLLTYHLEYQVGKRLKTSCLVSHSKTSHEADR